MIAKVIFVVGVAKGLMCNAIDRDNIWQLAQDDSFTKADRQCPPNTHSELISGDCLGVEEASPDPNEKCSIMTYTCGGQFQCKEDKQ